MKKSTCSFIAYIDESGDIGLSGKPGSSKWFLMSAFIVPAVGDHNMTRLRDAISGRISKQRRILHMKELDDEARLFAAQESGKIHSRCVVVLSNKSSAINKFPNPNMYYNYVARHLLERVAKCCSAWRKSVTDGDGGVKIVFATRKGMNYGQFKEYLKTLKYNEMCGGLPSRINWNIIDIESTENYPASNRAGLQLADVLSYSFFKAVEKNRYGMTNMTFAKYFMHNVYNYHNNVENNGIVIMNEKDIPNNERPNEFTNLYKK